MANHRQLSTTAVLCGHCDEPIERTDALAPVGGVPLHYECGLRMALGSVAHQVKTCGCYVNGSTESDPEGLSKRESARLVLEAVRQRQRRGRLL